MNDIEKVTKIVEEETGVRAVHLHDKPHKEHRASQMSCCWGSPVIKDGYEVAVCQPSIRSKGDQRFAFFTFKEVVE